MLNQNLVLIYSLKRSKMGLDSVELIMEFERYFKLNIPDRGAEQMYRINDVVHYLSSVKELKQETEEICISLQQCFAPFLKLNATDPVFRQYKHTDKDFWKQLEVHTRLKIALPRSIAGKQIEDLNFFQQLFLQ